MAGGCFGRPVIKLRRAEGREIIGAAADIGVALVAAKHGSMSAAAVDRVFRREKLLKLLEGQQYPFVQGAANNLYWEK